MKKLVIIIALMLSVMMSGCGKQETEASTDETAKGESAGSVII